MKHHTATRIRKLRACLDEFRRGKNVLNRTWRTWVGEDGCELFEQMWREQLELREHLHVKPQAVLEYEERLKKATFFNNRAEHAEVKGHASHSKLEDQATDLFAEALAQLMDAASDDPSLQAWFDRPLDDDLNAAPGHMPIVITSRSADKLSGSGSMQKMSKREVKAYATEIVLNRLEQDEQNGKGTQAKAKPSLQDILGRKLRSDI